MIQTTYPLYSSVQDDKEKLINIVKRITSTLAYITIPMLCLLMLVAKPLFVLLFTERWIDSVPYFQILCIGGMAGCLQAVNQQTIAAIGKSRTFFVWTIVKQCMGIAFQVVGLIVWGMWGLLVGKVLSSWFSYFVNISLVSKHVGYKNYQQLIDLSPMFIISGVAVIVSYYLTSLLGLGFYSDGIAKTAIFIVIYLGWSLIFKPEAYTYSLSIINTLKSKKKNK